MTTIGRIQFLNCLARSMSQSKLEEVETAYLFSKYAHRGQWRESGERYFEHPKAVALILIDELGITAASLITTALLHDVAEDSFLLSDYRVRLNFGDGVANRLQLLTKRPGYNYLAGLAGADWATLVVKLADRLHNQRTLGACPPAKQVRKNQETRDAFLPLAERMVTLAPSRYYQASIDLQVAVAATVAHLEEM